MAYGNYRATAMQDGVSNDLSRKRKELAEYNANYNPTAAQDAINRDWANQQAWEAEQEEKRRQERVAEQERYSQPTPQAQARKQQERQDLQNGVGQQSDYSDAWKNIIDTTPDNLTSNGQTITNKATGENYYVPNRSQQMAQQQEEPTTTSRKYEPNGGMVRPQNYMESVPDAEPEPEQPQTTQQNKAGNMVIPQGYVAGRNTTDAYNPRSVSRDYTDEEISQMQRGRGNLVVPRSYNPIEQNKENNAGLPSARDEDEDQFGAWRVLQNTPDSSDTPDNDWGQVIDNGSALAGTNYNAPYDFTRYQDYVSRGYSDDQAKQAARRDYAVTHPEGGMPVGATPVTPQLASESANGMPVLDLPLTTPVLSPEDAIRFGIENSMNDYDREEAERRGRAADRIAAQREADQAAAQQDAETVSRPAQFMADVANSPEYQRALEALNRQGIYGDEADRQARELVASIFNTENNINNWFNAEPDADIMQELVDEQELRDNYRDGTPQEQRYDARLGGRNTEPEMVFPTDTGGTTAYNPSDYIAETPEQKRERLARETEEMLNGNNNQGSSSVKDAINKAGDWLLENLIGNSLADSPEADIIDQAGNDFLRMLAGDTIADLVSGEEPTSETKQERLERMNDYLRENGYTPEAYNNYGSSGGGIMDLIDGIMGGGSSTASGASTPATESGSSTTPSTTNSGTRDWTKNPPKSRNEVLQLYLEQTGKNPNDLTSEELQQINTAWNTKYAPQTSGTTGTSAEKGKGTSSGSTPKGSETYQPSYGQGGQVVKAPYKEGGYTEQELMNMGNKAYGTAYGNNAYEGYYRAPDGHYYPVDQQKAEYYQRYGTYDGWDEGMRDYFNNFGTFYGYTPTWRQTGRNTGGGGNYSYSGGSYGGNSRSSSGYYGGNNYSGNYNSNVQPELTNQTRMRINNIMRNWTF